MRSPNGKHRLAPIGSGLPSAANSQSHPECHSCRAPLRPRVEMLANLVHAPGARHLPGPQLDASNLQAEHVPGARHLCDPESEC